MAERAGSDRLGRSGQICACLSVIPWHNSLTSIRDTFSEDTSDERNKMKLQHHCCQDGMVETASLSKFLMLDILCLYRFLCPVGQLNMEESRASLIWYDHHFVQTSFIFCKDLNIKWDTRLSMNEAKLMCKTLGNHPWSEGRDWKLCGIHTAAYGIKTWFLPLAHLLPLLVICRLVGHQGESSLTCRDIFGSAIHRSTVLPPVLRGLS